MVFNEKEHHILKTQMILCLRCARHSSYDQMWQLIQIFSHIILIPCKYKYKYRYSYKYKYKYKIGKREIFSHTIWILRIHDVGKTIESFAFICHCMLCNALYALPVSTSMLNGTLLFATKIQQSNNISIYCVRLFINLQKGSFFLTSGHKLGLTQVTSSILIYFNPGGKIFH